MDVEKAYDKVCRGELWRPLQECRVDENLIKSMSNLYEGSRLPVRLGSRMGGIF